MIFIKKCVVWRFRWLPERYLRNVQILSIFFSPHAIIFLLRWSLKEIARINRNVYTTPNIIPTNVISCNKCWNLVLLLLVIYPSELGPQNCMTWLHFIIWNDIWICFWSKLIYACKSLKMFSLFNLKWWSNELCTRIGDGTIKSKVTANDPTNFYLAIHNLLIRAPMHALSPCDWQLISSQINLHPSDPQDNLSWSKSLRHFLSTLHFIFLINFIGYSLFKST